VAGANSPPVFILLRRPKCCPALPMQMRLAFSKLLRRTSVTHGPKHHLVQGTDLVAIGGKAEIARPL